MVVDEVAEILPLRVCGVRTAASSATVSDEAMKQLNDYVAVIARLYHNNRSQLRARQSRDNVGQQAAFSHCCPREER
jgi:hypothetical protein